MSFKDKNKLDLIPDNLSDLCKFNFIRSISECQNGKINFLFNGGDDVDLGPIDNLEGVILFLTSESGNYIIHSTGEWYNNMILYNKEDRSYVSNGSFCIATVYNR